MPRESLPSEVIRPDPDPAASAPTAALVVPPGPAALALGSGEIRQFATELATQLFARWELALQEQFRAELGLRLEAELEHREREARQLREEVQERQQRFDNPWLTRNGAWGHATWEMENTIRRQASALAESELQMSLLRQRLLELGRGPEEITVTIDGPWEAPDSERSVHQAPDQQAGRAPADPAETGGEGEAA